MKWNFTRACKLYACCGDDDDCDKDAVACVEKTTQRACGGHASSTIAQATRQGRHYSPTTSIYILYYASPQSKAKQQPAK